MLEPPIFILDEPTSNLDIGAIRELKKIIRKWKDSGKTILIAEHRLWWTKDLIDRVLIFREGEIAEDINAAEFWSRSPEEFRSRGLRSFSGFAPIKAGVTLTDAHYTISEFQYANGKDFSIHVPKLEIPKGAVVAVLGNNGAGKSTFAKCLCGLTKCKVQIYDGNRTYRGRELRKLSFMVFQDVNHQLFSESALEDVTLGLSLSKEEKTAVAEDALRRMNLADCKDTHPMALSGGQKQRLAIAGALAGAGAALYYLSGNTEFYWSTYQSLPAVGFNGIPVALLALNNPIAVIFAGVFMAMLKIVGQQLTNLTAYNEYITDVIIAVIVYLSAFSLVIRMMLSGRKKKKIAVADTAPIPRGAAVEDQTSLLPEEEKAPVEAAVTDSDNAEGGDQA